MVNDLSFDEAEKLFRYSDQTWITNDNLGPLINRTRILTQLPLSVEAEALQVLRYRLNGHYEVHSDSDSTVSAPLFSLPITSLLPRNKDLAVVIRGQAGCDCKTVWM